MIHRNEESNYYQGGIVWESRYVDQYGKAIAKTPDKYPYSYDAHVTWRGGKTEEGNNTVYSDRLYRFAACCQWWLKYTNFSLTTKFNKMEEANNLPQNPPLLQTAVRRSFSQGDKVKIKTEDFGTIYGEFHRYGASRFGAIIFVDGLMRFIDEQSLNYA